MAKKLKKEDLEKTSGGEIPLSEFITTIQAYSVSSLKIGDPINCGPYFRKNDALQAARNKAHELFENNLLIEFFSYITKCGDIKYDEGTINR